MKITDAIRRAADNAHKRHLREVDSNDQIGALNAALDAAFALAAGEPAPEKSWSERWMRNWAIRHVGFDYYDDTPLSEDAAYAYAIRAGEDHHIGPHEDARGYINDEWWDHWEAITGKTGERGAYFSCGC